MLGVFSLLQDFSVLALLALQNNVMPPHMDYNVLMLMNAQFVETQAMFPEAQIMMFVQEIVHLDLDTLFAILVPVVPILCFQLHSHLTCFIWDLHVASAHLTLMMLV